jgi:hypothetical protein
VEAGEGGRAKEGKKKRARAVLYCSACGTKRGCGPKSRFSPPRKTGNTGNTRLPCAVLLVGLVSAAIADGVHSLGGPLRPGGVRATH